MVFFTTREKPFFFRRLSRRKVYGGAGRTFQLISAVSNTELTPDPSLEKRRELSQL
jgi:hypothetical protein